MPKYAYWWNCHSNYVSFSKCNANFPVFPSFAISVSTGTQQWHHQSQYKILNINRMKKDRNKENTTVSQLKRAFNNATACKVFFFLKSF